LSISNARLLSDIHAASSEELRKNLYGTLDLVGNENFKLREGVVVAVCLPDFSERFDQLERQIGELKLERLCVEGPSIEGRTSVLKVRVLLFV
jgi:hypothetical protein